MRYVQKRKLVIADITKKTQNKVQTEWENYGFYEPDMNYTDNLSFVKAVTKCIDYINLTTPVEQRVPREIIVAMAVIETGYGTSRFAKKGNNLFGVRTWTKDALVPLLSEWSTNPNYTNLIISKIKKVQKILANEVAKKS